MTCRTPAASMTHPCPAHDPPLPRPCWAVPCPQEFDLEGDAMVARGIGTVAILSPEIPLTMAFPQPTPNPAAAMTQHPAGLLNVPGWYPCRAPTSAFSRFLTVPRAGLADGCVLHIVLHSALAHATDRMRSAGLPCAESRPPCADWSLPSGCFVATLDTP